MKTLRVIALRLLALVVVLLGISLLVFLLMMVVPGRGALALLGPHATPERIAELERSFDLEGPWPARYLSWLGHLLSGDLGRSYALDRPVLEILGERIGPTLLLAGSALCVGSLLGLTFGSLAARYHGKLTDRAVSGLSLLGISVPAFWLAMLLMLVFGVALGWLPVSGIAAAHQPGPPTLADVASHLILPVLPLSLVIAGVTARVARSELLEALGAPCILTARAKGLSEQLVVYRHALRLVAPKLVPVIALQAGYALGGATYVETVFQWPGLARTLVEAVLARDLFLVQGGVLVIAAAYVILNFTADAIQRRLDPRIGS